MNAAGKADIGIVGLGAMGANLALNFAERGFHVAVYDRFEAAVRRLDEGAGELSEQLVTCLSTDKFLHALSRPRTVILLIPAGEPVDLQITELRPSLAADDVIIDAGNSNFRDTARRAEEAASQGPAFLGIGVSGGAEGARSGPAMMAGGDAAAWRRVAPMLRAVAARHDDEPCAAYVGPAGAGHFVKTVHNGIEYADMQMIAEVYGVMRDGLAMPAGAIAEAFAAWNDGPLKSYLTEISAEIAATTDAATGQPVLDVIADRAEQKGTGRWTAIEAQHLGVPVTTIDAAVAARNVSARVEARREGQALFGRAEPVLDAAEAPPAMLEQALICGKIACYAQGFDMLARASEVHGWDLPLAGIARIWHAGCIIRCDMLDGMAGALDEDPVRNLMFAPVFATHLKRAQAGLRDLVVHATRQGQPVPALAAAIAHFDAMRTVRSTANIVQAQRDFFGAHGFERTDREGEHHGPWGSAET